MATDARLAGVKTLLRSVLQSVKEGVPASRLLGDYHGIIGEPLAYRELGFSSLDAMMAAIPDVVRAEWDPAGQKVYKAVADDSTAHLQKLVSRQKSNKKRQKGGASFMRRPALQTRRGFRPSSFTPRPTYRSYNAPAGRPAHTGYSSYSFGGQESGFTPAYQQPSAQMPRKRNVAESPQGSVRITFQPSPSPTKPGLTNQRAATNRTMQTPEKESITFGESYKVPPRFERMMSERNPTPIKDYSKDFSKQKFNENVEAETFDDDHQYVALLTAYTRDKAVTDPRFETMSMAGGFVSVVNVRYHTYGSGGVYVTRADAEEAAARAACRSLRCIKGDPLYSPEDGPNRRITPSDISKMRERIQALVQRRPNGLWFSRLPIDYKDNYHEELPPNIDDLVDTWDDIIEVQGEANLKILYPVTAPNPSARASSPNPSNLRNQPSPHISAPPWRKDRNQEDASYPNPSNLRNQPSQHIGNPPWRKNRNQSPAVELTIKKTTLPEKGSTLTAYLSFLIDVSRFYVHIGISAITEVSDYTNKIATENTRLSRSQLTAGRYVTAQCTDDDYWYRAQIVSVIAGTAQAEVFYLDFGNGEKLSLDRLREMPSRLYKWPAQAVQCSLPNPELLKGDETTKQLSAFLDGPVRMTVLDHKDEVCFVHILDENGTNLFNIKPTKVEEPAPLVLPEENMWLVAVSSIVSGNQIILRFLDEVYAEKLEALEQLIAQTGMTNTGYVPEVGDLCAALITTSTAEQDNPWYRVRVQHVQEDKVLCESLDYGDTEVVQVSQLRPLLPAEAKLPYQAVVVYLTGLDSQAKNEEVVKELTRRLLNKSFVANVYSREGDPSVTLYDTSGEEDVNMNEAILEVINVRDFVPALSKNGNMTEGFVSYIDQDGTVHLQLQGPGLVKLDSLVNKVTDLYSKAGAEYFVQDLTEGRLVMSLNTDGWYRGLIRRVLPNRQVLVFFVDYGNEEVVPCTSLRELEMSNKALHSLPYQAVAVTLDELPPPGFAWTATAVYELYDRVPPEQTIFIDTVQQADNSSLAVVRLQTIVNQNFVSINEEMSDPVFWIDPVLAIEPEVEEEVEAKANEVTSETSLNVTSSSEGEISDVSVASQQANEILLETEGLLRELGIQAKMGGEEELPAATFTEVQVSVSTAQSSASPGRTTESKDLNCNEVAGVYQRLKPPPPGEVPPSGSSVFVTWVADPSNFSFVLYNNLGFSEDMMNAMAVFYYNEGATMTVDEPQKGELYAGLYEDERWYRVCIRDIINQPLLGSTAMVSALLVDFGSFNLLKVTELRELTAEFRRAPFQAIKATLAGVSPEAGIWSEDAIARFESLVLERKLVAWIHATNLSRPVPVTLIDSEVEGDDAMIHKRLTTEGLAVSSPVVYTPVH